MKKVLLAFGLVVSLAVVVIAGGIIYIVSFDPNENKDWLAQMFNEATGRNLSLGGVMDLTIYPWLGVTLNEASISNADGFSAVPMLEVGHAEVRVKFLPLLSGDYEIDTVHLQGARINLEVASDGTNNWDDLLTGDTSSAATDKSSPTSAAVENIILGGVEIEDTRLVYDNQSNNTHYEISNLAMTVEELVYGQPLGVAMGMDLLSRNPELASTVNLNGTVVYDVDNGHYNLDPLTLNAILSGPDVPSGTADIKLSTVLGMNFDEDTLILDRLEIDALGTHLTARVNASRVQTDQPAVSATLNVAGQDLAAVFRILQQNELANRIASLNNAFNLRTSITADMETGVVMIPDLQASLLNAEITGDLQASAINTDKPSVRGNFKAAGPDLPTLVELLGILQGGKTSRLSQMGRDLARVPDKNFSMLTSFETSMDSGEVNIPTFSFAAFGATANGSLTGTGIDTDTPTMQGRFEAKGADLPLLMQIVGQLQGGIDASLNQYGRRLQAVGNRAFTFTTDFNADLKEGNIRLPALDAEMLGFRLNGKLNATNMQASNGDVTGSLTLVGENLPEILTALGQADLAEVAQSMSLNLDVSGSSNSIRISPLRLDLVVGGLGIPNSPQTIALNADTTLNLEDDSIDIANFTLSGLGLSMTGDVSASSLSNNVSYKGALTIPAFNARNMLEQLNQKVATNDPDVLQKFELDFDFTGTANDVDVEEITLGLDDTLISGTLSISDFTTNATSFTLNVDAIDADRYLAPASTTASQAEPGSESPPLDVDTLRALDVHGAINIGQLTISGLTMNDIVVQMTSADGEVALNPVSANLYGGSFKSDMLLNVNGAEPTATFNTTLSSVNLAPLMQDFMDATYLTGTANIQIGLTGVGADLTSIKRNLGGNGSVSLEDGVLAGVDVGGVLGSVETMIRSKRVNSLPQGGQTAFNSFSSTLAIQNGVVNSNDLLIEAPGWKINGAGTLVDLTNDSINYNLVASVEPATATSNNEKFDIGGYSLPIACKGSIASPSCLPDAQQIIAAAVGNAVQQRLDDFLQDRLGGAAQQPSQESTEDPQAPAGNATPAEEPQNVEQELLNRALDRLLR